MKSIMFVLSVAVLTFNNVAATSGSFQQEPNFSHTASPSSSAALSPPEKCDTDDSSPLFHKGTSDFFGLWDD